jgi:2-dehydropantoate 2-reductase
MKILVVGAGATGGYFGALLVKAGRDVTFLVRPHRATALRERGLRLTGLGEQEVITPRLVTAAELDAPYDLVLLSVKATALPGAIEDMAPAIGPRTVIVPLLNGMAHLGELTARFGPEPVLGGVAKVVTTLNAEGDIVRLARLAHLEIGEPDGRPSGRPEQVRAQLEGGGVTVDVPRDVIAAMWHKWVLITTVGAVTCLMRGTVGDVNAVPAGPGFALGVLSEAAAVAAAAGHAVPEDQREAITRMVHQDAPFASSLYRDVVAGYPTEAEHVFGDFLARARALRVDTPLLDLATLHLRVHEHRTAEAAGASGRSVPAA